MDLLATFVSLFSNFGNLTWQMVVMWAVGALLIYLAIAKQMEPSLLLPMGFGAILVNLPLSGAITQGDTVGPISALFEAGMSNELGVLAGAYQRDHAVELVNRDNQALQYMLAGARLVQIELGATAHNVLLMTDEVVQRVL